jgi:hypothetical protein
MTSLSQSPRDRVLWILANNGGKMEEQIESSHRDEIRTFLNPTLEELAREGRIRISGEMVILI